MTNQSPHSNAPQMTTTLLALAIASSEYSPVWLTSRQDLSSTDVVNAMIEKIPGRPLLDKLRVIHLLEADLNFALVII
jgi:hypothetical protein